MDSNDPHTAGYRSFKFLRSLSCSLSSRKKTPMIPAREAKQKLIHSCEFVQLPPRRLQQCHASTKGKSSGAGDLREVSGAGSLGPRAKSGGPHCRPRHWKPASELLTESTSTVFYFLDQPQLVLLAVLVFGLSSY